MHHCCGVLPHLAAANRGGPGKEGYRSRRSAYTLARRNATGPAFSDYLYAMANPRRGLIGGIEIQSS